jgi:NAD+ kinase
MRKFWIAAAPGGGSWEEKVAFYCRWGKSAVRQRVSRAFCRLAFALKTCSMCFVFRMSKTIVVFGGSFNPPGLHHRRIAEALARQFDEVVVVPCGPQPDKPTTNDVEPIFRATLTHICFAGLPGVEVDLFDLEQATFCRPDELDRRYAHRGEVWHLVSGELLIDGGAGRSYIHREWQDGPQLWQTLRFAVAASGPTPLDPADLPPHHRLLDLSAIPGSSSLIREKIFRREPFAYLVTPEVAAYIDRYGLYRGRVPSRVTRLDLPEPRWRLVADERNAKAMALAAELRRLGGGKGDQSSDGRPNAVLVCGGDGTMLHAIRHHWQLRAPFFGVNAGHLGFLLNRAEDVLATPAFHRQLLLRQMPLLYVETQETPDGPWKSALAFNDAWVERATSQTAWIEVSVGGQVRLPKLVCDGALFSTASGSTAYARSMGATPLLADTPAWLLVGSNVMHPSNWQSALLGIEQQVELRGLDGIKRPLNAYVDGISQGPVHALRARVSRIAAVELAFLPSHDMAEKIAQIQFPRTTD